ncbi:hypothetical protein ACWDCB_03105 [Streptomyces sp. NPDC001178]
MSQGHDALPQPPPPDPGMLRIRVDPTFGEIGEVKLRVSPELADALLEQLQEDGAEASIGVEFGLDLGTLSIIAVMMRDNGAWATLRTAIEAVAGRHKDKRIRLEYGDATQEITGYGRRDAERLLGPAQAEFAERALKWQEMNRRLGAPPSDDAEN